MILYLNNDKETIFLNLRWERVPVRNSGRKIGLRERRSFVGKITKVRRVVRTKWIGRSRGMEQKRGGKMQEAVMKFEKSDEFSTATARREGRDGELM